MTNPHGIQTGDIVEFTRDGRRTRFIVDLETVSAYYGRQVQISTGRKLRRNVYCLKELATKV